MTDTLTTIGLVVLTVLSLAAWGIAVSRARRVARGGDAAEGAAMQSALVGTTIALGGALFIYRAIFLHERWEPLEAHVDGLLLIGVLLAMTVTYLVKRGRMKGLSLFALPFLAVTFAWAICASLWTFKEFGEPKGVWMKITMTVHISSVYGGMLFFLMAAIAGGMYLFVQRTLRRSHSPTATKPFASLEAIETLIVRTSALGFALLTLGLVTGLVIVTGGPTRLGAGWWYSPKVVLAAAAWAVYAVVMNVKHTTHFRGARAAWLSIAGLVLLLATFGIATALPAIEKEKDYLPGMGDQWQDDYKEEGTRWEGEAPAEPLLWEGEAPAEPAFRESVVKARSRAQEMKPARRVIDDVRLTSARVSSAQAPKAGPFANERLGRSLALPPHYAEASCES